MRATTRVRIAAAVTTAVATLGVVGLTSIGAASPASSATSDPTSSTTASTTSSTAPSTTSTTATLPTSNAAEIVAGTGTGADNVNQFDSSGTQAGTSIAGLPATPTSLVGVSVARGDVDSASAGQEIVVGSGPGVSNVVNIFSATGALLHTFHPYDPAFAGGVSVAIGDVDNDGALEIVTGAGPGGGPNVRVFDGSGTPIFGTGFMAYDPAFRGGVNVAAGNVNSTSPGDEIITGAGPGGGPHVRVFKGDGTALGGGFMAYDPMFTGGVYVAAGKLSTGTLDDIVTGAGAGGGPHVRTFKGDGTANGGGFMAYDPAFTGGVRVAAAKISSGTGGEIITGAGPGGGPHVRVFDGTTNAAIGGGFMAFAPSFSGGVMVAASAAGTSTGGSTTTG